MLATHVAAYRTVQKEAMSGRDIEAAVLTKAALKLKHCQDHWEADDRAQALDEALKFTQMIWSIFQGELMRPENPLPKKLRQDILSLSAFIDKQVFDVLANPAPEKLTSIIDINLNLAAGLRGSAG
jgi:flagellar biosynthesis activator protein FlaF